jgi:hypothetical protein
MTDYRGRADLPLGIRSNNPGNLRHSSQFTWIGEVGVNEKGFCIFDTMENGIRALAKNLLSYFHKHGLDTVAGIIERWAPPGENDTGAYITSVAGSLGVAPDRVLDLEDVSTLASLVAAISRHENGAQPVSANVTAAIFVAGTQDALATTA